MKWPKIFRAKEKDVLKKINIENQNKIDEIKIIQYFYDSQWKELKRYANNKGVRIIGDIPIYVSFNSVDVWINQDLFKLDENGNMLFQSGCPPDFGVITFMIGKPIKNRILNGW